MTPADDARVLAIARPDRALMKVYFVQALFMALGFVVVALLLGLKLGHEALLKGLSGLASSGWLPAVVGGVYGGGYLVSLAFLFIRFRTLRYRFDQDGVAQAWGLLFRRESFLAYARIQDVSTTQGLVERAFGLGTVRIQTASGAKGAEESLEGLRDFVLVSEFLRARTRGGKPAAAPRADARPLEVLGEIRDELRALRLTVERRR